ncbi:MAG TPA: DUF302 domain-containing protein [Sedimenticola thiotaurini]|uniref:DUF302 domain-containing protein n=1 Tax=Sedimenticola thiotaurini TaxID=1543721 RepID=A0A831W6X1_9GAMM|nr:DUF302 domain-containing protein [Sedimenticola thiotaurini]
MYGFSTTVTGAFDEVEQRVIEALKVEGFGVLSEIDVQAAMRNKLDVAMPRYKILGACNPPLAHQALQAEPDIGLLLPCNVVVREDEAGAVTVSFMDPEAVLSLVDREEIAELAGEVRQRLQRVRQSLQQDD